MADDELDPTNPFSRPSPLPFGLPDFASVRYEHYLPAFEAGMAQQRAEIEAIATDPAAPTLENTIDALERSGDLLARVSHVFWNLSSSSSTSELAAIEAEIAPRLAAHDDAIRLDPRLFARIDDLHRRRDELDLSPEQQRIVERYHLDFVRSGAGLDEAASQRLREINAELSGLTTAFKNRLLADTNDLAVHLTDPAELDGLSEGQVAAAAAAATARGLEGWLLTLVLPKAQPALEVLRHRDVRRRLHLASVSRGLRGNDNDTRETLTRIVALRAERAALLGHPDHAAYVVADQTAGTSDAVSTMLGALVGPAVANARAEAAELEAALVADGGQAPLQAWDWAYYARQVRAERFDLDTAAVRPYFELGRVVRDGVFFAATALYGLTFHRREDLHAYESDAQVYEVRADDGHTVGLFVADWYARDTKRGGAWMSTFADQSHLLQRLPVVVINLNVPRPPDGEPTLLTLDEVRTAFHEFGHVLHGLLSDVRYPRLSGTSVPRDFVEFPSQVNEMWAYWPQVLSNYAVHHETGEPLPEHLADALRASQGFGEGFATTEYLAACLVDLEWHRLGHGSAVVEPVAVEAFERAALQRHGLWVEPGSGTDGGAASDGGAAVVPLVPPRYRSTYFAHIFSGGYSAGYWSYIWSEVLDADTVEWFTEHGGLTRHNGEVFAKELLSRGGSVDPMAAFAAVRGRPPRVEPLLERRGLTPVE